MKLFDLIEVLAEDRSLLVEKRNGWLSMRKPHKNIVVEFEVRNDEVIVWHYDMAQCIMNDCSEKCLTDLDLVEWIEDWLEKLEYKSFSY